MKAIWITFWASLAVMSSAEGAEEAERRRMAAIREWGDLAAYFEPKPEWEEAKREYRSPLMRAEGEPVRTPEEWAVQRETIRRRWHELMGAWPPLLERPVLEVLNTSQRNGLTQQRVRVPFAAGQDGAGYLLTPPGAGPFPAVIVVYYDPETSIGQGQPLRDFAYQLARRGFVTLSIGSPGGDARKPETGGASCQPLSFLAYVAANCLTALQLRPEVDGARIGIVGHSYGGKWAMFAACLDERFACGAWSDPGIVFDETRPNVNYWERWYLGAEPGRERRPGVPDDSNPRTGAYRALREEGRDLVELQALMAPRPFWVSGGSEDPAARWSALHHVAEVNAVLGQPNGVGFSTRPGHDPTEESNELIYKFFIRALAPSAPSTIRSSPSKP